jgi:hypothetical protein
MCRRPLAYGHATATRILLGFASLPTGANDRERPSCDPDRHGYGASEHQQDESEKGREARVDGTLIGRSLRAAFARPAIEWAALGPIGRPCDDRRTSPSSH